MKGEVKHRCAAVTTTSLNTSKMRCCSPSREWWVRTVAGRLSLPDSLLLLFLSWYERMEQVSPIYHTSSRAPEQDVTGGLCKPPAAGGPAEGGERGGTLPISLRPSLPWRILSPLLFHSSASHSPAAGLPRGEASADPARSPSWGCAEKRHLPSGPPRLALRLQPSHARSKRLGRRWRTSPAVSAGPGGAGAVSGRAGGVGTAPLRQRREEAAAPRGAAGSEGSGAARGNGSAPCRCCRGLGILCLCSPRGCMCVCIYTCN